MYKGKARRQPAQRSRLAVCTVIWKGTSCWLSAVCLFCFHTHPCTELTCHEHLQASGGSRSDGSGDTTVHLQVELGFVTEKHLKTKWVAPEMRAERCQWCECHLQEGKTVTTAGSFPSPGRSQRPRPRRKEGLRRGFLKCEGCARRSGERAEAQGSGMGPRAASADPQAARWASLEGVSQAASRSSPIPLGDLLSGPCSRAIRKCQTTASNLEPNGFSLD